MARMSTTNFLRNHQNNGNFIQQNITETPKILNKHDFRNDTRNTLGNTKVAQPDPVRTDSMKPPISAWFLRHFDQTRSRNETLGAECNPKTECVKTPDSDRIPVAKICKEYQLEQSHMSYETGVLSTKDKQKHDILNVDVTGEKKRTNLTGDGSRSIWTDTITPNKQQESPSPERNRKKKLNKYRSPNMDLHEMSPNRNGGWPVNNFQESLQFVCCSDAHPSVTADPIFTHNKEITEHRQTAGRDSAVAENSCPSVVIVESLKKDIGSDGTACNVREKEHKFASAADGKGGNCPKKSVNFQSQAETDVMSKILPIIDHGCQIKSHDKELNTPQKEPSAQKHESVPPAIENKRTSRDARNQIPEYFPIRHTTSGNSTNGMKYPSIPEQGIQFTKTHKQGIDKNVQDTNIYLSEINLYSTPHGDSVVRNTDDYCEEKTIETRGILQEQVGENISQDVESNQTETYQVSHRTYERMNGLEDCQQIVEDSFTTTQEIRHDENTISQISKDEIQTDTVKQQTNFQNIVELQKSPCHLPSNEYISETVNKETSQVKSCSTRKSTDIEINNGDEKLDGVFKKEKPHQGKSLNIDNYFAPVAKKKCTEVIKEKELMEIVENSDDMYDDDDDYYYLAEPNTESLDSRSIHLLHQLEMVQMCKRKANILLKHVQSIIHDSAKHSRQKQLETHSRKTWQLEQQLPVIPVSKINKSRLKSGRTSPMKSVRKHSPKIVLASSDKQRKRGDSHRKSPEKITAFELMNPIYEDLIKSSMNIRNQHRSWEGTSDNSIIQLSGTPVFLRSKIRPAVVEHTNDTAKYKYRDIQQCSTTEKLLIKENQSRVEHDLPRVCYEGRHKHDIRLLCRSKKPEVYSNAITGEVCYFQYPFDKARVYHRDNRPSPCYWSTESVTNYEHVSNTSESVESICAYNEMNKARQPVGWNTRDEGMYTSVAPEGIRYSRTHSDRVSPNSYRYLTLPKSKHTHNEEQFKIGKCSLRHSLKEALKSANESISAAARVAEVLNCAFRANSGSSTSVSVERGDRFVAGKQQYYNHPKSQRCHSVEPKPKFHGCSPKQYKNMKQQLVAKNMYRNSEQFMQSIRKNNHGRKGKSQSQGRVHSLSSPQKTNIFSCNPRHVNKDRKQRSFDVSMSRKQRSFDVSMSRKQRSFDVSMPRNKHMLTHKNLRMTESRPKAWRTTSAKTKCPPDVDADDCANHKGTTLNHKVSTRSPQVITIHITFSKSPENQRHTKMSYLAQSSHDKKENHDQHVCLIPDHRGMSHCLPTSAQYENSSGHTLSQEERTNSHSNGSSIHKTNSCISEATPTIDPTLQDFFHGN